MNELLIGTRLTTGQSLQLVQGDITEETSDAIVNAANAYLESGAGVAGAILHRGGAELQRQSAEWVEKHGPVQHDSPAWTSGGNLPCRFVIHAVGPVWGDGDEASKLAAAVRGSLRLAENLKAGSLSLPAISTGIYGFPKDQAAMIHLTTLRAFFTGPTTLKVVRVVLFDTPTVEAFVKAWHDHIRP
jgi:O-acetyl-ADP-ribose deacetylase (regulator of RNase III)